jgi:hypothetical protein
MTQVYLKNNRANRLFLSFSSGTRLAKPDGRQAQKLSADK